MRTLMEILESGRKNIVIVGAGFGGITALLKLHKLLKKKNLFPTYNLVLVAKSADHLYTPALYEIAAIPPEEAGAFKLKSSITIPISDIIAPRPEIRFIGEAVVSLNPESHIITLASGVIINFEFAIIAIGSETKFFDIPGLREYAYPLKTFEDAIRIRNHAEVLLKSDARRLHIVVGGGGPTGVEVSAELIRFFRHRSRMHPQPHALELTIVDGAPTLLPGFNPVLVAKAKKRLEKLGVLVRTNSTIREVSRAQITFADSSTLPYEFFIWSGGTQPATVLKKYHLPLSAKGGLVMNEYLEVMPRIYGIGDCTSFIHPKTQKPLPGNVPIAEAEARIVARNIVAAIEKRPLEAFRPLTRYPYILAVGGKYALTDLIFFSFSGVIGWVAKQLVELRYLLSILPLSKALRVWARTVYYSTLND